MVNVNRLIRELDELAAISSADSPAVTRVLFSEEDVRARAWLRQRFEEAGLEVRGDAVGNVFARWLGTDPTRPAVATGSHIDAIPNAGRYDGTVGVLGALEAVRSLGAAGVRPVRSIEIIMFTAEEPTRFGLGCLGSRMLSGSLSAGMAADLRDVGGDSLETLRQSVDCTGSLGDVPLAANAYRAFVELHIEQGPLLERQGLDIGAVEKIAAPAAFRVHLTGESGHAGAVLMPDRHDAGLAAAEVALAVERAVLATGCPDTVGTTGVFRIESGAINSVPGRATLEIDLRDTAVESRDQAEVGIRNAITEITRRRGVEATIDVINADPPATCDPMWVEKILAAASARGFGAQRMISRAYHDTLFMAQICPSAMIFIPCRNGWSHRPDEFASAEAIGRGVEVLADVLADLAAD